GFNQRIANKVLVLVDGRPEWQDFLGFVLWPGMPVGLEEIERIEIIRGPGSALYGANAMLGVINVITRTPGSGPRAAFNGNAGSGKTAGGSFVASGGAKALRYRVGAGFQQANKWSRDYADDRTDIVPTSSDTALGLRAMRGNLNFGYDFSKQVQLSAYGGVSRIYTELYPLGILRNFYIDGVVASAKTELRTGPVKLKLFWNHLSAEAGPQYSVLGQRSLVTNVQANLFDAEVLFTQRFSLLGEHTLNVGVSGRFKRVNWDYLDQPRTELHLAAFFSDEWRILDPLRIVASYRVDRHPLLNLGQPGFAHSPRVSLLWSVARNHALRASFSTAFREPTFLESYMAVRVPVPGVPGTSLLSTGDRALRPERLLAFELGYRGEVPALGIEWDLALYQNNVTDLISLSSVVPASAGEAFDSRSQSYLIGRSTFQNEPDAYTARGVEAGLKVSPVDGLDLRVSGAYQGIVSSSGSSADCTPCASAPAFKVNGGASYRTPINLDFSAEAAYVTSTLWLQREPSPADPTQFAILSYPLPGYAVINARIGFRFFDNKATVAVVGTNLGPAHAQHPFGNLIERRVLGTLTVIP
ncbi:MAG: TonB-dependent receptor plug domain-containing protein, partial [Myxococcaceae bacterium]